MEHDLGTDATGAPLHVGSAVHVDKLARSPYSSGVVLGMALESSIHYGEPWVWVHHNDGSTEPWPAVLLRRDVAAPVAG